MRSFLNIFLVFSLIFIAVPVESSAPNMSLAPLLVVGTAIDKSGPEDAAAPLLGVEFVHVFPNPYAGFAYSVELGGMGYPNQGSSGLIFGNFMMGGLFDNWLTFRTGIQFMKDYGRYSNWDTSAQPIFALGLFPEILFAAEIQYAPRISGAHFVAISVGFAFEAGCLKKRKTC